MPGNSLCGHKVMTSLEEPSKSGRNVRCERGKKKAFVETILSSYSSGTEMERGCGNKYHTLTINSLFLFFLNWLRLGVCWNPSSFLTRGPWSGPRCSAATCPASRAACSHAEAPWIVTWISCYSPPASNFAPTKEAKGSIAQGGWHDVGYSSFP